MDGLKLHGVEVCEVEGLVCTRRSREIDVIYNAEAQTVITFEPDPGIVRRLKRVDRRTAAPDASVARPSVGIDH